MRKRGGRRLIIKYSELKSMAHEAEEANVTSFGLILSAAFVGIMWTAGIVYRLDSILRIALLVVGMAFVPIIMFYHYYQKCENIRFNQVDVYIHQMAYSFQRNPKILVALKDTYRISEGNLKTVVLRACACMESEENAAVYRQALGLIEAEYPCDRIYTLHRFMMSVEERGGDYSQPLSILLEDFDRWVRRVYKYQEDMRHVKVNSLVGIVISCALASMSVVVSNLLDTSEELGMDITMLTSYQAETFAFVIINMIYFIYVTVHYSKDWITQERSDKEVMRDYRIAFSKDSGRLRVIRNVILAVSLVTAVYLVKSGLLLYAAVATAMGSVIFAVPAINRRICASRIKDDVYSGFSEWLREVAINLSHAPLQAAIQQSYATCPAVIRPSLTRFIYELEENPTDVTPYYTFLKEFRILDISSTVKTLYAITENNADNMSEVISNLISRKYELVDKHEALRNQNTLSALRFAEYIPLLIVSIKIGMDMMLVVSNYMI